MSHLRGCTTNMHKWQINLGLRSGKFRMALTARAWLEYRCSHPDCWFAMFWALSLASWIINCFSRLLRAAAAAWSADGARLMSSINCSFSTVRPLEAKIGARPWRASRMAAPMVAFIYACDAGLSNSGGTPGCFSGAGEPSEFKSTASFLDDIV